jgi:hypothetical protein
MFGKILGCASGGGRGGDENNLVPVNHDIFDDRDAAEDFENVLLPPAGAATITQPQGGGVPLLPQEGAHVGVQPLGVPLPPPPAERGHPPPPPPHLPGGGGNAGQQPAAGDKPYWLRNKKTGSYNVQPGHNQGQASNSAQHQLHQYHEPFVIPGLCSQCPTFPHLLSNAWGTTTRHHDPHPINPETSAYQGRVLAFIRDQRATKEPNPVCMPTTKTWEWFSGDAVTNFAAFEDHYATKASRSTLWMPVVGEDTSGAIQVPHLLAIPNVLVDLLRTQGMAIMPHKVLMMMDDFIASSTHPTGQQWECVCKWCLVAGQSRANGKSKVFLETSPVTINDDDFDLWVVNCLGISLGPRPGGSP